MTAVNGFYRYLAKSWHGFMMRNIVVFNYNSGAVKFNNVSGVTDMW